MKKQKEIRSSRTHQIIYAITDVVLTIAILAIAFINTKNIFYSGYTASQHIGICIYTFAIAVSIFVAFYFSGVYRSVVTSSGFFDFVRISFLTVVIHFIGFIVLKCVSDDYLPYIGGANWILVAGFSALLLPISRYVFRAAKSVFVLLFHRKKTVNTLVIGAGAVAKVFYDECLNNKNNSNRIVAFVDDDVNKIGGNFSGIPVKGPVSDISKIIDFYNIEEVVIAIAELSQDRLHEFLDYLEPCNVRVRRMPFLNEMNGLNDKKVIDIDLNDLLSRKPIELDNSKINEMLTNQVVLVTGAGGSIGSELVRQIFATHPKTLVLFDIYENSTYDIQQELVRKIRNENIADIELVTCIGSTYNLTRIEQIFKKHKPNYIYHAAAYKHVPLMEDSPMEAIRTNVIGTYNVAYLANKYHAKKMLLVSTDKAVRPTNVMGATKRFAETIIQYFANKSKTTYYCAVRFGNVLGSNGSVIPLFKKQIEEGGPITVTDKNITRFFMTIPEAVGLILQCSLFAAGGEIFILDMGKPVKILHLAEKMIRQAGYIPYQDIDIKITGLRPGEKIYEELLINVEKHQKTSNKKIYVEKPTEIFPIEEEIKKISEVFDMESNEEIKSSLKEIITTYTSPEEFNNK